MSVIKSNSEQRYFCQAACAAEAVCSALIAELAPGVSTTALESKANQLLASQRSLAPFKQFSEFGHAICVSINDEIVNGPPSRERVIQNGDVVSIALGTEIRGFFGKIARTTYVGEQPSEDMMRLLKGTQAVIPAAVAAANSVSTLNELLTVIPETAKAHNLTVIQGLGGSGIGKALHDYPATPNNPDDLASVIPLEPGLAFTLMPMFSLGQDPTHHTHEDGWTYVTNDGALSAHVADTFLMTPEGLCVLTVSDETR